MLIFLHYLLLFVGSAYAACHANNCARAVTGTRLGAAHTALAKADCSSFVNAPLDPSPTVPSYASACADGTAYSSACSCFGITGEASTPTSTPIIPSSSGPLSISTPTPTSISSSTPSSGAASSSLSVPLSTGISSTPSSFPTSLPGTGVSSLAGTGISSPVSSQPLSSTPPYQNSSSFPTSFPGTGVSSIPSSLPITPTPPYQNSSSIPITLPGTGISSPASSASASSTPPYQNSTGTPTSSSVGPTTTAPCNGANLQTDPLNCGICGNVCSSGSCVAGSCSAAACGVKTCGQFTPCNNTPGTCFCFTSSDKDLSNNPLGFCGTNAVCNTLTACAVSSDCSSGASGNVCAIGTCCSIQNQTKPGVCLQGSCGNPADGLRKLARMRERSDRITGGTAAYL